MFKISVFRQTLCFGFSNQFDLSVMVKMLMQLKTINAVNATTEFALVTKGQWFKPGATANDKLCDFFGKWNKKCNSPPAEEILFCLEAAVAFKFVPIARVSLGSSDDARTGMTLKRSFPAPVRFKKNNVTVTKCRSQAKSLVHPRQDGSKLLPRCHAH